MADDSREFPVEVENCCLDLVAVKYMQFIPALLSLAQGRWHNVREVVLGAGMTDVHESLLTGVVVGWLDDPTSNPSWVSVIFHHYKTSWTRIAHFNSESLSAG